jgi:hypothetical protein
MKRSDDMHCRDGASSQANKCEHGVKTLRDVAGYQVGWVDGIVGVAPDGNGNEVPVLLAPTLATLGLGGGAVQAEFSFYSGCTI